MDKLQFAYTKRRNEFGRQCMFVDRATELDVNVLPQAELTAQFIRKNPVDVRCEDGTILSEHETNTNYTELESVGMNHTEGGWPKDISPNDIEQTTRYRRKAEKEEGFIAQVSRISQEMEHGILQSNAVDIYQQYFGDDCLYRDDPPLSHAKVINNFRDPTEVTRPVSQVVWHPDGPGRIAVAHCVLRFQGHTPCTSLDCYIWRTEDICNPELVLTPLAPVLCLRYNPKDLSVLAGGQYNGQVVIWDLRKGNRPMEQTALPVSHRDPVYDVTWVQSKSGTECFSTSTDGQVLWWDVRSMDQPIDQMYIDASRKNDQKLAEGGICLEYDITAPTKFMVGTEKGNVFACSRRAKTPGEKVVTVYSGAQTGPVYALQRNPFYAKHFLTVGDWTAKVWSEDCKDSPLLWTTKYSEYLTDGCWSPTRPSVLFVTKTDGTFDVWDLMFRQKSAEYSVKVSDDAIQCINVQEQGQMVCVGTDGGLTVMLQLSEGLVALQRNERVVFSAMLERETKREKILEGREREKKLLHKKMLEDEENKRTASVKPPVDALSEANKAFFEIIEKEKARLEKENNKFVQFEKIKTAVPVATSRSQSSLVRSQEEEEEPEQGRKSKLLVQHAVLKHSPIIAISELPSTASVAEAEVGEASPVDATVSTRKEEPTVEKLSALAAEVVKSKESEHPEAEISHQPETDEKKSVDDHLLSAPPPSEEATAFDSSLAPTPVLMVIEEPENQNVQVDQTPEADEKKESEEPLPQPLSPTFEEHLVPVPDMITEHQEHQNQVEEANASAEENLAAVPVMVTEQQEHHTPEEEAKSYSSPPSPIVVITEEIEEGEVKVSQPENEFSDVAQKPSSSGKEKEELEMTVSQPENESSYVAQKPSSSGRENDFSETVPDSSDAPQDDEDEPNSA